MGHEDEVFPQKRIVSSDDECVSEGVGPRVRYGSLWLGSREAYLKSLTLEEQNHFKGEVAIMAEALWRMEKTGAAPELPDGKIGGNASFVLSNSNGKQILAVTKSGKYKDQRLDSNTDVCFITQFDADKWECQYHGVSSSVLPTSDTPMHHAVYATCADGESEMSMPRAILHGHALQTVSEAERLGYPVSCKETLCSTPDDTAALVELLKRYPYPTHRVFIRKGHGFMLLGENMHEVLESFNKLIAPYM